MRAIACAVSFLRARDFGENRILAQRTLSRYLRCDPFVVGDCLGRADLTRHHFHRRAATRRPDRGHGTAGPRDLARAQLALTKSNGTWEVCNVLRSARRSAQHSAGDQRLHRRLQRIELKISRRRRQTAVNAFYADVIAPESGRCSRSSSDCYRPRTDANAAITPASGLRRPVRRRRPARRNRRCNDWFGLHRELHEPFDEFTIQTGVDDLYLIEPDANTIVYSTAKGHRLWDQPADRPPEWVRVGSADPIVRCSPEPGVAQVRDFTSYAAAGDEPSMFVAAPVLRQTDRSRVRRRTHRTSADQLDHHE